MDPVKEILLQYGIKGDWEPILGLGVANRIYATNDAILRIAADHPDSLSDAYTESVAAPVARAAGVLTPRLIAFDDSRNLIDRPFSLWERVHGETLGALETDPLKMPNTWIDLGKQLGLLHTRIKSCPDPKGYLDKPARETRHEELLQQLRENQQIEYEDSIRVYEIIEELKPPIDVETNCCFLHGDLHDKNILCSPKDHLLAIIDWGDAGWGDPVLDFASIPLEAVPFVMQGYESEAPGMLGSQPAIGMVWDKLYLAMKKVLRHPGVSLPLDQLLYFLNDGFSTR
ncbi:MAG: aminoglycoside phosphotransferase family protein [Leptolyngbyaceae cyanobacterium CSU_1_3]|nr:aminoglycoside phosphotransferase family protein [Microcoleus sp. SM1_3_4]NJR53084.1 aminoglycoside phosphotransferase family protein [Leptolyngbyaceae cyanobacterium CSU_1_3]